MQLLSVANQEYVPTLLSCFCRRSKTTKNDIVANQKDNIYNGYGICVVASQSTVIHLMQYVKKELKNLKNMLKS